MSRARRVRGRARWVAACCVAVVATAAPLAATAQEIITTGPKPYDRARVSGFWWRGETNGTITAPQFAAVPLAGDGIDVTEELGVDGGANGWLVSADVGFAPRHRVMVAFAGLSQNGAGELDGEELGTFVSESHISLQDVRAAYEFLFVTSEWVEVGALAGVGYFDSDVDIAITGPIDPLVEDEIFILTRTYTVSEGFNSAYPLVGAGARFEAEDVLGIYAELTGFPSVEVGGQSGWLMNLAIDFIVSPTDYMTIVAGYKRYQLSLEDGTGIGINLVWDGFVIGADYIF